MITILTIPTHITQSDDEITTILTEKQIQTYSIAEAASQTLTESVVCSLTETVTAMEVQ